jgi:tetratricopeptide (TPR) repeat protein
MTQDKSKYSGSGTEERLRQPGPRASSFLSPVIIAIVSFAVYSNSLFNGFILDDYSQVLKNPLIRDIKHLPEIFLKSAWTFEGAPPFSNYYRPLQNLFYMFIYNVFGAAPWGFHLTSILFHAGSSVLVFLITARLLSDEPAGPQSGEPSSWHAGMLQMSPPLVAGLLFATHPVHTEAVNWTAGMTDILFTFFYLLSFYLYIRSRDNSSWNYAAAAIVSFVLAILSKEPGLTLPGVLMAYDYFFKTGRVRSRDFIKRYAPYFLIICVYFAIRSYALGGFTPMKRLTRLTDYEYFINVFPLFSRYLYKLLLPADLNFWPVFIPIKSLLSEDGITSLCVTGIFTGLMIAALKKSRVVFLSLLFILLPLAPAFYLKGIIGKPFAERYLYLPSFGFVMFLAFLLQRIRADHKGITKGLGIVFILIIGIYSFGTISRNAVWKDAYSLFADTVTKSPDNVVPRMELGNALLLKGLPDEAIKEYQAALIMEPNLYVIHYHLGLAFAESNRLYEAIEQYQRAIMLNPDRSEMHEDLGRAFARAGFKDLAAGEFESAVSLRPSAYNYNLLGVAYAQAGALDKALGSFRTANSLDPAKLNYRLNMEKAAELKKPEASGTGQWTGFNWEYEERLLTNEEMFSFAW